MAHIHISTVLAAESSNCHRAPSHLLLSHKVHLKDGTAELASVELILTFLYLAEKLFYPWEVTCLIQDAQ